MGLRFSDLSQWHRWQQRQHLLRRLRHRLRPGPPGPNPHLWFSGDEEPQVLVIIESGGSTPAHALGAVLPHLTLPHAVLAPAGLSFDLPKHSAVPSSSPTNGLRDIQVVLCLGGHLPLAAIALPALTGSSVAVVQHGLLPPLAPPLPARSTLLAWNGADAAFYTHGRSDLRSYIVGSQLFWTASQQPAVQRTERPVYLGQLHGAELPRSGMTRAAIQTCRKASAVYRPHPAERDKLSRWTHTAMGRLGITIDANATPLPELGAPVISVFSTGVLESAAIGLPAYVHYPRPPRWLREFWDRYDMRPWGGDPTPAPQIPETEPARLVADWVVSELDQLKVRSS